ncbi:MAG TPA: response regulator [Thermoanaerobaculia bacterium]|jgi:DNA-binding response OmpR family regulator|nr:response regulator [Thermoanaerobaculia bacterium]
MQYPPRLEMNEQLRRVLVVDDDPEIRRILVTALRLRSLAIDEAVDGQSAVELLRENRYAVVLLDIMMPGMDGFGVLDAIDRQQHSPVVLVVSGAGKHILDRVDTRKIHGIVKKPFDPLEIADVVSACAEIRGRSAFETMAYATIISGAPLIALLRL